MSCWDCEHLCDTVSGRFYCYLLECIVNPDTEDCKERE